MNLKSPQSEISFDEAGQIFDLVRLQSRLEAVKQGKITATDWKYFKGILCGKEVRDIAELCCVQKGTIYNALNKRVKPYLYQLLDRPEPEEETIDYGRVSKWLLDAGYGLGKNWQQVCRAMLDRQKKLSTNQVIESEAMQFDLLNDKIFVSLALVEWKDTDRLRQDVHPARSTERYDEQPPIAYETFREQVLQEGKSERIAIIGEPGAGKTTLLQHIAFWILDQGLGLPIWISLGDLIKDGELQRLKDYLTQVWLEDAIPNVNQNIKTDFLEQLNKQRVWLLLDGADEIVASSSIALREIDKQLRGLLSQPCILLTCRLNIWDADINALRDFQTYRTKEFQYPIQVEQFIESGFCKSNPQSGQSLKIELAKPERIRLQQLVRSPLRLMMLCTTWHEQKGLPSTKAELYERFVGEFYKWNKTKWKKKDLNYALFPNTKAKQEKLNQALGRLACHALDKELSPFRLPHGLVFDELGDPDEDGSDFWLALNLGWLQVARNSDKPSEKVYTFFHPTFQEYFAALAIDDWDYFLPCSHQDKPTRNRKAEVSYRIFESQWKEVFLLWIGRSDEQLKEKKEQLIKKLTNFEDGCRDFYSFRAYFLAAAGISELDNFAQAFEIVDQLLSWGLGYQRLFSHIGDAAREILQETNRNTLSKVLVNLLKSENRDSIHNALDYIYEYKVKSPEIYDSLIPLLEADQDERIRCEAACCLERIKPGHTKAMHIILSSLRSRDYRGMVARCLGDTGTGNSSYISALKDLLKSAPMFCTPSVNDIFYYLAACSLLKLNPDDEIAIRFLNFLLNQSSSDYLHGYISQALNMNGVDNSLVHEALMNKDPFINILIHNLEDLNLREFSTSDLNLYMINQHIIPELTSLLNTSQSEEKCNSVAYCLEIIFSANRFEIQAESYKLVPRGFNYHSDEQLRENSKVLWYCAQKMSYPDFYNAWHSPVFSDEEVPVDDSVMKL